MSFENEKSKIQNNHALWNRISEINAQYKKFAFDDIDCPTITTYQKHTSKAKYGKVMGGQYLWGCTFDFKEFLVSKIFEEKHLYTDIVKQHRELATIYYEYEKKILDVFEQYKLCKSADDCIEEARTFWSKIFGLTDEARFKILHNYEYDLMDSKTFSPVFPTVKLILSAETQYDVYSREVIYSIKDIIECYDLAVEKEGKMSFVKKQRAIVTDSLRYDVLKRDGFRCCICGATANDGVKLEVDHIVPISKGGKSILGNLQTLCERCNRGKGTK